MEEIKIKGYCNLVVKKGDCNPDEKGIKIDLMGTMENPYLCLFPKTKKGKEHAKGNCNGYETYTECEIIVKVPTHRCNCEFCKKKKLSTNHTNS